MIDPTTFDPMTQVGFIRIYNERGEHSLTLIPCDEYGFDIATPDGKVMWCGLDYDLFRKIGKYLPIENDLEDL